MNRMLVRVCAIGGAVLCSLVVFVGTAQAATGVSKSGNELHVDATAVHNEITISQSGTDFRVHDERDVVTAGPGCRNDGPHDALCSMSGISQIIVRAGAGNDIVQNGTSTLCSLLGEAGNDKLTGGPGTDVIDGGTGADEFHGGGGFDTASYRTRTADLFVWLNGSAPDGEAGEGDNVMSDVEAVLAGSGNDELIGSDDLNRLVGGDGIDVLRGRGGNDTLVGENGNDTVYGENGDDRADYGAVPDGRDIFNGGADTDTASYAQRTNGVNVTLDGVANDGGTGEGDNNFSNVENAIGGAAGDTLIGNSLPNRLNGQVGNDTVRGMAGDDLLIGDVGDDSLIGDAGADTLNGNAGNDTINGIDGQPVDTLNGGVGTDICRFDVGDTLYSCNP